MKEQVYKDERPPEHFQRFHERVRRGRPAWAYEVVRLVLTPYLGLFFRTRAIDSHKVPTEGAVIIAPNHFSFLDHFFVAVYMRRKVQFLAKSQLFKPPMQFIYSHGGVFPILRGRRDDEAFRTAHAVLGRGDIVVMYAEGGRSRTEELQPKPQPGIGRLALETGAPVVPIAVHGSAKVRNGRRGEFPKVTVQYGDPIRFERVENPTRDQQMAVAEEIFGEIRVLHSGLETLGRKGVVQRVREQRRLERRGKKRTATA